MPSISEPWGVALDIAEGLLFPDAAQIDAAEMVPKRYLDALAEAGLYGLFGPTDQGGYDADPLTAPNSKPLAHDLSHEAPAGTRPATRMVNKRP